MPAFLANAAWPPTRLTSARNNETTSSSSNIFIWKPPSPQLTVIPGSTHVRRSRRRSNDAGHLKPTAIRGQPAPMIPIAKAATREGLAIRPMTSAMPVLEVELAGFGWRNSTSSTSSVMLDFCRALPLLGLPTSRWHARPLRSLRGGYHLRKTWPPQSAASFILCGLIE